MNPSSALAVVLVDELVRNGIREAVLSPGSRSAPLAYALHDAEADGRLRLHVRIDERSAGFLALGLSKASGLPVPVVTTSGTAVANLHPAVLEASHSGVPLIVLSADRPPELRGVGANQTVDQRAIYGSAVREFRDMGAPDERAGQQQNWRSVVCRAVVAACGTLSGDPGPVQLNLALREPLVPSAQEQGWHEPLDGRPGGAPWTSVAPRASLPTAYVGAPRTLVVLGQAPAPAGEAALALARARGWPVLDELDAAVLLDASFAAAHRPQRVLVVGAVTTSRSLAALLHDPEIAVDVVSSGPRWADAGSTASTVVVDVDPASDGPAGDVAFARVWSESMVTARAALRTLVAAGPVSGPAVAMALADALPSDATLFLGASSAIRDAAAVGGWRGHLVLANRGASGIDGTVSSAIGAALAAQRNGDPAAYALMGDLTFLHDHNGLVIGPQEPRPDLCVVVVNDDGGSIFARLEPGEERYAGPFERVFATPHGTRLDRLCAATGTPHELVTDALSLPAALRPAAPGSGIRVVEVRVSRRHARRLQDELRDAVVAALAALAAQTRPAVQRT